MVRRRSCDFSRIEQAGVYPSLLLLRICFLLDLVPQLLLKVLLLSRSANSHAMRLKTPHPLRMARVTTTDCIPIAGLELLLYFPAAAGMLPSLRAATPLPSERSDGVVV